MNADVKKRGLGRGLDALFQDAKNEEASFEPRVKRGAELSVENASKPAATTTAPRTLPVDRLVPGQFQPRRHFDEAALDQLAASIAAHGVLQPLLVRPLSNGSYEIIAGERRWRAAQKAQVHDVPVIMQDLSDNDALEIALIENLQREDLNAIEEAEGYQRLIDEFGHTQEVLAEHLGKSRSHVTNMLRLNKLPASIKKHIETGALSAGHARALVSAVKPEELAKIVLKRGLSVRQTEKLVQQVSVGKVIKKPVTKGFVEKDVDLLALEQKMTALLGLNVTIDLKGAGGTLSIAYTSLDQLDDILERLSRAPKKK